ncbi:ABC transporter ATP-binding protein [Bacilliculturomica massiliensis]|uniref:ABC transporter ATP-binding protein n=1 Tax=Bacilliculturomica massiliensis TaxID=1917867 RepID=UPI001A90E404|nr:ABC transporter ATP-binding protein [Bacilliculturomica massiliensis]
MSDEILVKTEHLKKYFPVRKSGGGKAFVKAVDDVTLEIGRGETVGLVGESGSGKTTIAKMILGLLPPTENTIYIDGKNVWDRKNTKEIRKKVGAVFQDPASSLNPRSTVYRSLERPLLINGCSKGEAETLIRETAAKVNLGKELLERFPYELSGGQQQRVSIARAIMLRPRLLVLDEPTSALDVSVQAQTLNELLNLQQEYGMSYLFITHNLSVVRYMSDRICVMYGGKVMESGKMADVYENCVHPYTFGLMSSVPPLHPRQRDRKKYLLTGDMPSLIDAPEGCRFCTRCKFRQPVCESQEPAMKDMGDGHFAACHFAGEIEF